MGRVPRNVAERFWEKVDRRSYDECWPWLKGVNRQGYGKFCLSPGQLEVPRLMTAVPAHRVAFYLVHGHWPEPFGLHGCDNPVCCNVENPEHVHEGTPRDNGREMSERGRATRHLARLWRDGILTAPHGADSTSAALTWEQAEAMRVQRATARIAYKALGEIYGVSEMTASRICRGLRYIR